MKCKNVICASKVRGNRNTRWIVVSVFLLSTLFPFRNPAQDKFEYDEISVSLIVQGIGSTEIPALVREDELYLPINDIFNFLKIKNTVTSSMDTVTGFFINPNASYLIDRVSKVIIYQERVVKLEPNDLVRTETNLYLNSSYFGDVFGLMCTFNFRSLSVNLNTKIELPAIREMRLEQMHKNIRHLNGEIKADTVLSRTYPLFSLSTADWAINNLKYTEVPGSQTTINLALGGILAGGEARTIVNYITSQRFTNQQIYYFWRFANNDNYLLRQVMAGNINTQATSSIYAPVIGAQLTNTPTTFRRSFGHYTLSKYTQPGWMVELYVNNVLVDYVKADDSGFFTFDVPLVYGNTQVTLRYYGPWGEEITSQQNINIPYNFLPAGEFEYTATAGITQDLSNSFFSRASLNYGVNRFITVGGGMEFLSSLPSKNVMPFFKTSINITSDLLFTGEYVNGVRSKGLLSFHMPSDLQLELDYTVYDKTQTAINTDIIEERKAVMSFPFQIGDFMIYSRINIGQNVLPNITNTMADLLLSGSVFGVSANFTTNATVINSDNPYLYSSLALSFRLPDRFTIRPQTQFDHNKKEFTLVRCDLEKQLFGTFYINAVFEKNFANNFNNFQLGLRYELPFMQTGTSINYTNVSTTLLQSLNGSLMYEGNTNYLSANTRTSVGKSGIVILPYLDINGNGSRDLNEPKVLGLNVHINSGRIKSNEQDSTIFIFDLEPYTDNLLEFSSNSFDNVAWRIINQTVNVSVNPNQFRLVEVPISVMGEVSGMVYLNKDNSKKGQDRIYVCFYKSDSTLAGRVLSEPDGFFSFMGLKPGSYTASIDPGQLKTLHMTALPNGIQFNILPTVDGDVKDGLEFVLTK